jgi:hypothetical protein
MTAQPGGTEHRTDVRDTRYGEIFLIRSKEGQLIGAVYNTTGRTGPCDGAAAGGHRRAAHGNRPGLPEIRA